ncbi:MAG: molecular chaperone HtpG [Bacteroidales bacterium]|jgi:molecular chaperone HtpG|nr:molecular chaperone HtpG [Bacteroidales bacterium]
MKEGIISMQSENMFPIIKKFLYSDHEIFLRELVSNAVDATTKLQALVSIGKATCELGDITINISIDAKAKTLTISDKGVGMSAEEVEKYINNVAFSGANEFLEKYKGVDEMSLIGHFGLGFYSAFMVADKVEIITQSFDNQYPAVKWTCEGTTSYTLEETTKSERGTDVILHISEDSTEFLQEGRILEILRKYCRFLPVPIRFGTEKIWKEAEGEDKKDVEIEQPRIINNTQPLWKSAPSTLTEEDYDKFYFELYPNIFEKPLFHIHINIDYPFNLTGILSFPKLKNQVEFQKNRIQLYCNQVYITDQLEGIVPDFLMLLHGVIDSPDIPLNVSRSYLQSDSNVKKISAHISKKVADKLEEMFTKNREDFQSKWDDMKTFMYYGTLTDEKFFDRAQKFILLKNTENKYFTIEEYKQFISALQTDKDSNVVALYASNTEEQYVQIAAAKEKGYDVLLLDGALDIHFINLLEQKNDKLKFKRIDADVVEKLIEKGETFVSLLSKEQEATLQKLFENALDKDKFLVQVQAFSQTDFPVSITQPEFMRRWADMQKIGGGGGMFGMEFNRNNFILNANHEIMNTILEENDPKMQENLVSQLVDLALLSNQMLSGAPLANFVKRSLNILSNKPS